jgi:hypothetical protein
MNAAAHPTTSRRRARRRRLIIALLVALFTLALGAGVDDPQQVRAPSLMALVG